ncbi:hypothetical protein [Rhodococcus sp. UNC363MFTsu5.1]|uniref:hypothetical protein n=1 Tax=Rhodococcus sp. UNC363MFTsu5.1 TaxID=1449069 RepID=UPI0012DE60F9|nr:hypothetical protein [Rhodococcus sp. UNC363MFTsu5.1]
MTGPPSRDVRELLGMDRPAARVVVALFCLSFTLRALTDLDGVRRVWPIVLAAALLTAAAVVIIAVPGDPMPRAHTLALTAVGPIACALVLWQLPVPGWTIDDTWQLRAVTAVLTYMSVRGRAFHACVGAVLMVVTCGIWSEATGQGWATGIRLESLNLAPVLMSVIFAVTVRPVGYAVFRLREQESERAADEATTQAVLRERDTQLTRLDLLARPLLERSATGDEFDDGSRVECGLVEERLRDTLRAPVLASDEGVSRAVESARRRGAKVILLDDGGLRDGPEALVSQLHSTVIDVLDEATGGTVTARVLPEGRATAATILSEDGAHVGRVELGHDGRVRTQMTHDDLRDIVPQR